MSISLFSSRFLQDQAVKVSEDHFGFKFILFLALICCLLNLLGNLRTETKCHITVFGVGGASGAPNNRFQFLGTGPYSNIEFQLGEGQGRQEYRASKDRLSSPSLRILVPRDILKTGGTSDPPEAPATGLGRDSKNTPILGPITRCQMITRKICKEADEALVPNSTILLIGWFRRIYLSIITLLWPTSGNRMTH
jgi:hypothetical protein